MDLATVIAQVNRKAGMRRDPVAAQDAVTLAIEALEGDTFLPWFLLSERSYALTTIGDQRIPVPERFLKGYEDGELFYQNQDGFPIKLYKKDYDDLVQAYSQSNQGEPQFYAKTGNYYRIFPVPDKEYTVFMIYYKRSGVNWDDPDNVNPWLEDASRLVIAKAAMILMEDTRDQKGLVIQEKVYQEERAKLLARNVEHEETNNERERWLT